MSNVASKVSAYLVLLDDVTPNRATAISVQRFDSVDIALENADGGFWDVLTDADLVPAKGERVWIERGMRSSGRVAITGRA